MAVILAMTVFVRPNALTLDCLQVINVQHYNEREFIKTPKLAL